MRKRILYPVLLFVLLIGFIVCSLRMLYLAWPRDWLRDEEAARTPDVDFYIQYASERFGVPAEEISVVQFDKATSQRYGLDRKGTIWIRPDVRLEWDGKMVCFEYTSRKDYYDTSKLRDDYYYDELVEGVREYYMRNLGLDNVIVVPNDIGHYDSVLRVNLCYGYSDYLGRQNVTEINDAIIADFTEQMGDASELYVELKGEDPEAEVKKLIDKLKQIDCDLTVFAMKSLSDLSLYHIPREEIDRFYGILPLCFERYHLSECWYEIEPDNQSLPSAKDWIEYQGYYYYPYELFPSDQNEKNNNFAEAEEDT